jgi:CheY-like chemotaxis protein
MGHEVVSAADGDQAGEALSGDGDLRMALPDWVMSGMSGVEIDESVKRASDHRGRL